MNTILTALYPHDIVPLIHSLNPNFKQTKLTSHLIKHYLLENEILTMISQSNIIPLPDQPYNIMFTIFSPTTNHYDYITTLKKHFPFTLSPAPQFLIDKINNLFQGQL